MTTVAYRDGVMAADTASYIANLQVRAPGTVSKVYRLRDGSLFSGAGSSPKIAKLMRYIEAEGLHGADPPRDDVWAILVTPDRRIWSIQEGDVHEVLEAGFYATGSGAEAALGAMHHGATAEEAVRIAMLVDPYTSGEVISIALAASPALMVGCPACGTPVSRLGEPHPCTA
jgi:ATP-dependent protease HslVU (ClpYQ) peptidase subunit